MVMREPDPCDRTTAKQLGQLLQFFAVNKLFANEWAALKFNKQWIWV